MTEPLPPLLERPPTANKDIPLQAILELKLKYNPPLTDQQIADMLDCSRPNITQRLAEWKTEIKGLKSFKNNRADIFATVQNKILNSITEVDIKGASLRDRALSMGIFYDKERLERDLSTQNIDINALTGNIADIQRQRQEITDRINQLKGVTVTDNSTNNCKGNHVPKCADSEKDTVKDAELLD